LLARVFTLLLFVGVLTACAVKAPPESQGLATEENQKVSQLALLLVGLDGQVDTDEAQRLAGESVAYAYRLAEKYELVWPPLWHNTLVNVGLKERGLCYQWADDMLAYMQSRSFAGFEFYLGVTRKGTLWEHNTLVVSAKGASFSDGIVLDPWRDSGELFFSRVEEDEKYRWSKRDE